MTIAIPGSRVAARSLLLAASVAVLGACTSTNMNESLPRGDAAIETLAPAGNTIAEYRIKPFDVLTITTFQEPGLTFAKVPVDAAGQFSFPFIGRVDANGQSPAELENTIKQRLDARYTQNAQVTIFVAQASGLLFTVEGDVKKPGSFEYVGRSTLLQSIARAGSPEATAKLDEVAIFREINGERFGGIFNLNDIREGRAADPEIHPGDTVVVGYSAIKSGWQQFLALSPILNAFTRF